MGRMVTTIAANATSLAGRSPFFPQFPYFLYFPHYCPEPRPFPKSIYT
jgi:hypothetical protein